MSFFQRFYIGLCATVCVGFVWAALAGYRTPNLGIVDGSSGSGGRSYGGSGGSWGGGK